MLKMEHVNEGIYEIIVEHCGTKKTYTIEREVSGLWDLFVYDQTKQKTQWINDYRTLRQAKIALGNYIGERIV